MLFKNLNKVALALAITLFLGACATQQATTTTKGDDAYTGTETVKFLADGVPDRVFFSTNKSELTSAATTTLGKQATYLKVVYYKTAKLFESAAELGAIIGGADDADIKALAQFGKHMGLLFS